jgi:uncharacterized protein (DUF433 family)/UDP-3-O-[3-hydroxymyristoyl] glucosamine N-acyltransferase
LREDVIVSDGCVLGNSCEFKNALLFNNAQVPHFSYVGDSILGYKAHLGAGVKISNLKLTPGNIFLEWDKKTIDTGLRKFGAVIGDHAEVGCNAVLNPGTVLGRHSLVYPNTSWRGVLPENHIAKNRGVLEASSVEPYRRAVKTSSVIQSSSEVLGGTPVFAKTRVPVKSLFDHLEAGDSIDDFLEGFPSVKREQVIAILEESKEHVLNDA